MLKLLSIKRITPSQKEVFDKLFKNKIDIYSPSITFLSVKQRKDFKKRCVENKIYSSYEIKVDYKYKNDINKLPFLIYLTKKKAKENINAVKNEKKYTIKFSGLHFKKVCRQTLNNNIILADLILKASKNKGEDNPGIYFPPKADYWSSKESKEVELYKQPSKKTITIGYKKNKKDINDFIKKLNIKKQIEDYYPTLIYLKKKELKRYLNHVKKNIKAEEKFGRKKVIENENLFILQNVTNFYLPFYNQKSFIFYLTKSQIKDLDNFRTFKPKGKNSIVFYSNQFVKTYEEVIRINFSIYYYKNIRNNKPYNKKSNTPKLLAISDKPYNKQELLAISDKPYNKQELLSLTENLEKDLIDFSDEEKDLIDFSDEEKDLIDFSDEEKDLIDLNVVIPNPKPTAKELLMDKELFPKGKKYKVLNEDLIQTNTKPSTNGENILKNILNYPETKRLLGISLTTDLKSKIKNLDSEASFGLASIISSLLTANRGKMSIYSISRNQLKEIIEGFITTLSVLLNPTQKY